MKLSSFNQQSWNIAMLLAVALSLLSCVNAVYEENSEWQTITYDTFDHNWGSFAKVPGSSDAKRAGKFLQIRDDSGDASSVFHGKSYDVSNYIDLRVSFRFQTRSMEASDSFYLEYLEDSSKWEPIKQYVVAKDFANDKYVNDIVTFSHVGKFPQLDTARIRFRCDASNNGDRVFLKNIRFEGLEKKEPAAAPSPSPSLRPSRSPSHLPTRSPTQSPLTNSKPTFDTTELTREDICPRNRQYPPEKSVIAPYVDKNLQDKVDDDLNEVSSIAFSDQTYTDRHGRYQYAYMVSDKEQYSLKLVQLNDTDSYTFDASKSDVNQYLNGKGKVVAAYTLFAKEPKNDDWEDISLGPCTDINTTFYTTDQVCIYIGNTGNNPRPGKSRRKDLHVYKFVEPTIDATRGPRDQVVPFATIEFNYGDGFDTSANKYYDAEALFVDWTGVKGDDSENAGDIYIATKSGCSGGVGKIPVHRHRNLAPGEMLSQYSMPRVVNDPPEQGDASCGDGKFRVWQGADMRRDGQLIAMIRQGPPAAVYFFPRTSSQSVSSALSARPCDYVASISYGLENEIKQEAVAFMDPAGLRFGHISECQGSCRPSLYRYDMEYPNSYVSVIPEPMSGWQQLSQDNFENGSWGSFTTGGSNAKLSRAYACQGNWAAELRDDRGISSSVFHKHAISCDQFSLLRVTFQFRLRGYDHLDTLFLEISLDNGFNYAIVGDWAYDTPELPKYRKPLRNAVCYTGKVLLDPSHFRATTFGNQVKLRFRNSGDSGNDRVYIDNIQMEGHLGLTLE